MSLVNRLTLVTSNERKAEQFSRWLNMPIEHVSLDLPELQTMDMDAIVRTKVQAAYETLKRPVIAEDTSLGFTALSGLPGPFTKFFLKAGGPELLCRMADLYKDRQALYSVWIAYADEHGIQVFHGDVYGSISAKPSEPGTFGFGFDQCFVPDGYSVARAALDEQSFDKTSARKLAIESLKEYFASR